MNEDLERHVHVGGGVLLGQALMTWRAPPTRGLVPAATLDARRGASYLVVLPHAGVLPDLLFLAFFASRFSFSDLLAAVFEFFDPPLSLPAMLPPLSPESVIDA